MAISQAELLKDILEQQLPLAQQLLALLVREKDVLGADKQDELTTLNQEKQDLITQLANLHAQQKQIVPSSLEHFLKTEVTQPLLNDVLSLKMRLEDFLHRCQEQNEINGTVVNVDLHNVRRILDIFCGRDKRSETYDAKGQRSGSIITRQGHTEV